MLELRTDLIPLSLQETQNKPLESCHALTSLSLSKPTIRAWTRSRSKGASARLQTQTQQTGSTGPVPATGWGVSLVLQSSSLYYPNCIVEWAASSLLWSTSLQVFKKTESQRGSVSLQKAQWDTDSSLCLAPCSCWNHLCSIKPRTARKHLLSQGELNACVSISSRWTWCLFRREFPLHRPSVSRSCTTSSFRGKLQKICTILKIVLNTKLKLSCRQELRCFIKLTLRLI